MKKVALKNKIKIGSICCGMGGFDTGLRSVGFETVWAIDIMREACESFKLNHTQAKVICKDAHLIENFTALGKVDGLVFGPPCQGFSRGNSKRTMEDSRNFVYLATLKAVEQCDPEFFIFENVIGLMDMYFSDGSSVFEKIKSDYENCGNGYFVTHKIIDCSHVGVPQANRFRLIMVGYRKDLNTKYTFLPSTHGEGRLPLVTQRDTIWHLKDVDQTGLYYDGEYDWKFISRKRQKGWDEPSYTVEASARYAKIHPGYGKMKFIEQGKWFIPKECRRLSVLESKLIQTFPSDYKIYGNLDKQYTQIGNAVPPRLASFIGIQIARYYASKEAQSTTNNVQTTNNKNPLNNQEKEKQWILSKLKSQPNNSFYKSLLSWIESGKMLTERQRAYVQI